VTISFSERGLKVVTWFNFMYPYGSGVEKRLLNSSFSSGGPHTFRPTRPDAFPYFTHLQASSDTVFFSLI
jgi:hypothetical protein